MQNNFSKCREWVPRGTSQHKWRWLTTLLLILTLGIGQMWGDDPKLTIANPDQIEYSQDGVYVTSPVVANAKMGNKTNQKCFYVTSSKTTASLNVFSKLTNIKSISFDMVRNTGSGSLGNAVSLYVSKGDEYTIPTSTDFSAKRNNSDNVTSLQNVQAIGNNVTNQVTNISVTFTSNVKAIEFRNEYSSGTYVRNLVVTYESGTLPDTYLKATMLTSANDAINMDVEPTGVENASITANTDVSKKAAISEKNYCKMDGTFTINLGTGKTFVAGDQIIVDVCASAVKKQVGITIDSKTINTYLANTIYSQLAYVVKTGDGIIGKQTATFERTSSDTYIHSVSVLRAPAATYSITYHCNGATSGCPSDVTSGATALPNPLPAAPSKTGCEFDKWYTNEGLTVEAEAGATLTADANLYAGWTVNTYSLTWDANGGSITSASDAYTHGTVAYGTTIVAPSVEWDGHDFLGWNVTPAATMPDENVTYTAQWQTAAAKHAISYDNLKGADVSAYPTEYTQGIGIASFAALADTEDEHFLGWSPDHIGTDATTDMTITATWEAKKVVTFNAMGGSSVASQKVASGTTISAPSSTRTNWTLQGWTLDPSAEPVVLYDFSNAITEDLAFTAVWARNTISGASSDVVIINGATINTGGTLSVAHYFSTNSSNGHVKYAGAMKGTGSRFTTFTIPANHTAVVKEATVYTAKTFAIIPESDISGIDFANNTSADATVTYANAYFSLTGASGGKSEDEATVNDAMGAGTYYCGSTGSGLEIGKLTLTVSETPLTVTFKANGTTLYVIPTTTGETLGNMFLNGALPTPSVDGFTFNGWKNGEDAVTASTAVGSTSMVLNADLTPIAYNVTLESNNSKADGAATVHVGAAALTIATAPTAETGYGLLGYYTGATNDVLVADASGNLVASVAEYTDENGKWIKADDATLYAQWEDVASVAQIGSTKYATFAEAAAAVADGETIQLLQDCDYDATWTITGMAVTLDLNGKNLTGPASGDAVAITTDGVLTIMDGTATVDPSINGSNEITYAAGKFTGEWLINVYAGGSFVMNSGWLLAGEAAAWVTNSGIVTVNNGVLEALTNAVVMGPGNAGKGGYTMNIHGGILLGHMSASGIANGYSSMAVYHPNTGTLNIDGGTLISENGPGVVVRGGASNITGGTIIAQGNGGGKCGDANAPLIGEVGVAYDFKANYPGVSSVAATISGTANVSGADGAVQAIYAATEPTATEEAAVAISGGTFSSPVAEALCADDYYPATKPSGKYGVTYAALSVNFAEEAAKTEGQKAWTTFLTDNHYDYNLGDGGEISWDKANAYDTGLKLKKSTNNAIYFTTEPGKLIELTVGNIAGMTIQINGGEAQPIASGTDATNPGVSTYYSANAQTVVLKETSGNSGYNMLKSINIRDPYTVSFDANGGDAVASLKATPAINLPSATNGTQNFAGWYDALDNFIGNAGAPYTPTANIELVAHWEALSTVNTLSDLQVDGVTVDGFASDVHTYYIVVPYGTAVADLPKITSATPTNANANVAIWPAAGPQWTDDFGGCYRQQANVTPQDPNAAVGYNDIRITIGPKDGICMIWGNVTDNAMTRDADKSKYNGTLVNDNVRANAATYEGKTGPKFQKPGYLSLALEGQSFKAGDVVEAFITQVNGADKLRIFNANEALDGNVIAEGTIALGASRVALPVDAGTIYLRRGNDEAGESYKDWNPCVAYVAVYRISNPILNKVTVAGVEAAPDNTNHVAIEVPFSTTDAALDAIAYDWISNNDAWTAAHAPAVANTWEWGVENAVTFTDKDGDESVYYITISKAVASSDATLSALTVNGQAIALADGVFDYTFELPYGTTIAPTVVAAPNHVAAVATVNPCTLSGATITVVPESGAGDQQVYTLTFAITPWKEVVIWDGSTMGAVKTVVSEDIASWEVKVDGSRFKINDYSGASYGTKGYSKTIGTAGTASDDRYFKVTIPKGYVAKLFIVFGAHADDTGGRGLFVSDAISSTAVDGIFNMSSMSRDNLTGGYSEIFAGNSIEDKTYYLNPTKSIDIYEVRVYLRKGYARTDMLGNGVLGTVCVPNNVAVEDIQGVTVYELVGREPQYGKIAFDEIVSGELEAGVPYVFQANGDKMVMFYGETKVDDPVDKGNGMYGTFVNQTLTNLDDVYYFAQRALWSCVDLTSLNLPANRAYVKLSEIDYISDPNPAPGRRRITMTVNGEKVATDVENLNASEAPVKLIIDGKMYILRGEKLFDATGRLVK